jgi:hypothetical protein
MAHRWPRAVLLVERGEVGCLVDGVASAVGLAQRVHFGLAPVGHGHALRREEEERWWDILVSFP